MFCVPEQYRVTSGPLATTAADGNNGLFVIPRANGSKQRLSIIASDGEGWEHVSVSMKDRMPGWDDMCYVQRLFWSPEALVVQYHAPVASHINNHKYCLHMWRPVAETVPVPPGWMIGIKGIELHG